jgi:small subunit ribosomal protein S24e
VSAPAAPANDPFDRRSDVLHPNRPNVSKDELRQKLSELYKSPKDSVSVFGFRTQFGGGKSTGFALIYESNEALKKFEPQYRLIRYEMAQRAERPSRAQRTAFVVLCAMADVPQASSARTRRRSSAARPRSRASPRRRTSRRVVDDGGCCCTDRRLVAGERLTVALVIGVRSNKQSPNEACPQSSQPW